MRPDPAIFDHTEGIIISSDDSDVIEITGSASQRRSSTSFDPRLDELPVIESRRTSAEDILNLTLELSPLEQSAPRRYIRIAMALPWAQHDNFLSMQLEEVRKFIGEAFFKTLQHWPFLGGCFYPSTRDASKLKLRYPENLDRRELTRLVRIQAPDESNTIIRGNLYRLEMETFGKERFVWEDDPEYGDWFPPVTVKISFVDSVIVLGFAFSEVIFDGEFLQNFFRQFTRNTYGANDKPFGVGRRSLPEVIDGKGDMELFPCYDWSCGIPEYPTPRKNLRCQVITLDSRAVQGLYGAVQEVITSEKTGGVALYEDCILAMFWVAIMRTRFQNGRFGSRDLGRVNYSVPGASHTRNLRRIDPQHCSNSTITVVASCSAQDLIRAPNDPHDSLPRQMRPEDVALAAQLLRSALQEFNVHHLCQLTALKNTTSPIEERAAYERALRRHTDSLTFENWICYGTDYAARIPFAQDQKTFFFPCNDHIREGTAILLPRKGQYWGNENWNVCVCLAEDDLGMLLHNLEREGWWKSNK
ncbi:hypothetical protein G7Z17_g10277 [Cylindrodendrum hubeiense]|uniref:Uncharacterized protein n=1 Tax=Cylindrodendrum hubeiense TaxID=595255 RepID=A0A9P5H559_9HYPO|nr:hypothetical protein G7Z17_g10277 [Cylindrodendrum hubeiense]